MKQKIIITLSLILIGFLTVALKSSPPHDSGPAKRGCNITTGAPGQGTCCSCHSGPLPNGDMKVEEVLHNNTPGSGYYFASSLHVIITELLSADSFTIGGLQMISLDTAGNSTGSWLPGNTTNSPNAPIVHCNSIDVVEQPHGITPFTLYNPAGIPTYRIYLAAAWFADPTYHGPVNFYAAGIAADNDSTEHGDVCYRSTLQLLPAYPLALTPHPPIDPGAETMDQDEKVGGAYQQGGLYLIYPTEIDTEVSIRVTDITGRQVIDTTVSLNEGTLHFLPICLAEGYYLFQVVDQKTQDFHGFKLMVR